MSIPGPRLGSKHHGHTRRVNGRVRYTPTYYSWRCMRHRCYQPTNASYWNYGARGIRVCERWNVFANFLEDMGERPPGMYLDRRDPNKDYAPDNCRWAPLKDGKRNFRSPRYKLARA